MSDIFQKLNLKNQRSILALNAPTSFEPELASLNEVVVRRSTDGRQLPKRVPRNTPASSTATAAGRPWPNWALRVCVRWRSMRTDRRCAFAG